MTPLLSPIRSRSRCRQRSVTPDLTQAPPSFPVGDSRAVFVDVTKSTVDLTLDVQNKQTRVKAVVELEQPEEGFPVLDLVPNINRLKVDGQELPVSTFMALVDPDRATWLRVIRQKLPPGKHIVEVEYTLKKSSYNEFGVEFEIEMSDLEERGFLENYFPSSFEYDQHPTQLKLNIVGASLEHRVMTNGRLTQTADGAFTIDFPDYFTASSHYLHVFDPSSYFFANHTIEGKAGPIPVTLYGQNKTLVGDAWERIRPVFREMEDAYGPYAHASYIGQISNYARTGGGMEYVAATRTSVAAAPHETRHMWGGRGMMPGSGNAGWIDEAFARWHDRGCPRASEIPMEGSFPPLASFSPYKRETTQAAYGHGAQVMSELDYLLRDSGGLKPVIAELYRTYARETLTTEIFLEAVQRRCPTPLDEYFRLKVYGGKDPKTTGGDYFERAA